MKKNLSAEGKDYLAEYSSIVYIPFVMFNSQNLLLTAAIKNSICFFIYFPLPFSKGKKVFSLVAATDIFPPAGVTQTAFYLSLSCNTVPILFSML